MAPKVDFKRVLQKGVEPGNDIIAVKRAVSRHGNWPWMQFDSIWHTGPGTFADVGLKNFQKQKGLTADSIYGPETHKALINSKIPAGHVHAGEWCFDQTSINLYTGAPDPTAAVTIVKAIFKWWRCAEGVQAKWHYSQRRPIDLASKCDAGGYSDCSGMVVQAAHAAGAKSPDVVYGYSGWGNTDSLRRGGKSISLVDVNRYCKDHYVLAFFGSSWDNTEHVIAAESYSVWHSDGDENAPEIWPNVHYSGQNFLGCRAYAVI
jgi:hypothetical protein